MDYRKAKLCGVRAAAEAHEKLGITDYILEGSISRVDIFSAISEIGVPALCRPLDGLLGAYINNGILVTTNRRLPIQRFTAAHEFGHHWMKHDESFDTEKSIKQAKTCVSGIPEKEVEAEAFASEFLTPKTLIAVIARQQGWNKSDFQNPATVYQLSLRLGTSYEASFRALFEHGLIIYRVMEALSNTQPRGLKEELLGNIKASDFHRDVYHLKKGDDRKKIFASSEDYMHIELEEHSSGGYQWTGLNSIEQVSVDTDELTKESKDSIGSINSRHIIFHAENNVEFNLIEKRAWETEESGANSFDITIDFHGKEVGLPRAAR